VRSHWTPMLSRPTTHRRFRPRMSPLTDQRFEARQAVGIVNEACLGVDEAHLAGFVTATSRPRPVGHGSAPSPGDVRGPLRDGRAGSLRAGEEDVGRGAGPVLLPRDEHGAVTIGGHGRVVGHYRPCLRACSEGAVDRTCRRRCSSRRPSATGMAVGAATSCTFGAGPPPSVQASRAVALCARYTTVHPLRRLVAIPGRYR
jgi:hypothetical protein